VTPRPSAEDAHRHFAAKHSFARWDPRVLPEYIAAGIESDPGPHGGVRLAFSREVETRLYNTLPDPFGTLLQRHPPQCPVAVIGGTQSGRGAAGRHGRHSRRDTRPHRLARRLAPVPDGAAAADGQAVLRAIGAARG
jgi:hypothetical protein